MRSDCCGPVLLWHPDDGLARCEPRLRLWQLRAQIVLDKGLVTLGGSQVRVSAGGGGGYNLGTREPSNYPQAPLWQWSVLCSNWLTSIVSYINNHTTTTHTLTLKYEVQAIWGLAHSHLHRDALQDVWVVQTTQVSSSVLISSKLTHTPTLPASRQIDLHYVSHRDKTATLRRPCRMCGWPIPHRWVPIILISSLTHALTLQATSHRVRCQ